MILGIFYRFVYFGNNYWQTKHVRTIDGIKIIVLHFFFFFSFRFRYGRFSIKHFRLFEHYNRMTFSIVKTVLSGAYTIRRRQALGTMFYSFTTINTYWYDVGKRRV